MGRLQASLGSSACMRMCREVFGGLLPGGRARFSSSGETVQYSRGHKPIRETRVRRVTEGVLVSSHMAELRPDSSGRALCLVAEAARRAGLDGAGAAVLRVRSSIHVELPGADVVARVEGPGGQDLAMRQVLVARALAARDAPVTRLVRPEIQPLLIGDRAVTLWRRLRSVATPTLEAVGRAVRAIHEATAESLPRSVPTIDPFAQVRASLDSPSSWSGSVAVKELQHRTNELASSWQEETQDDPLGKVVVHGDPHADNAVASAGGLVLLDLEDAGVGPASWDFAPLAVGVERYGLPAEDYRQFAAGYGAEPGTWPGHSLMCRVYELLVTSWAVRCSVDSPRLAREATVRISGVLEGDPSRWTLL